MTWDEPWSMDKRTRIERTLVFVRVRLYIFIPARNTQNFSFEYETLYLRLFEPVG